MNWDRPNPQRLWHAIETYLRLSYPGGAPPSAVRKRLDQLKQAEPDRLFDSPAFERDDEGARFALRLGNAIYPHTKFVIERSPDGQSHLFRADTHDRHCRPAPESREYAAFCELCDRNQRIARDVETAWEAEGLPTFKTYLKADLARRRASAPTT